MTSEFFLADHCSIGSNINSEALFDAPDICSRVLYWLWGCKFSGVGHYNRPSFVFEEQQHLHQWRIMHSRCFDKRPVSTFDEATKKYSYFVGDRAMLHNDGIVQNLYTRLRYRSCGNR